MSTLYCKCLKNAAHVEQDLNAHAILTLLQYMLPRGKAPAVLGYMLCASSDLFIAAFWIAKAGFNMPVD